MRRPPGVISVLHRGQVGTALAHWLRAVPISLATLVTPRGNQIPAQRNMGAAGVVQAELDWVLFVDTDSVPPAGALEQLLGHGQDLVGAVVLERTYPFDLVAVKSLNPPARFQLSEVPRTGLVPVVAMGMAFTLVRRRALEQVPTPWFRCGQIIPDLLLEDTDFCLRAGRLGIQPYLDCGLRVGHATDGVIWPGRDGRPWVEWFGPSTARVPVESMPALGAEVVLADA